MEASTTAAPGHDYKVVADGAKGMAIRCYITAKHF